MKAPTSLTCSPSQRASVAQLVEQRILNPRVEVRSLPEGSRTPTAIVPPNRGTMAAVSFRTDPASGTGSGSEIRAFRRLADRRVPWLRGLLRHVEHKRGALPHRRLERNPAAVPLHDLLHDVQAQPRAADPARVATPLKPAEQARVVLLGDADAVVAYGMFHSVP